MSESFKALDGAITQVAQAIAAAAGAAPPAAAGAAPPSAADLAAFVASLTDLAKAATTLERARGERLRYTTAAAAEAARTAAAAAAAAAARAAAAEPRLLGAAAPAPGAAGGGGGPPAAVVARWVLPALLRLPPPRAVSVRVRG